MAKVAILVPFAEMCELAQPLLKTCGAHLEVICLEHTETSRAAQRARELEGRGCDLIIARGYTAVTLSQKQNVPILPLQITTLDILHAIIDCRDTLTPTPRKIGCVGRGNEFESLNSLTDVLNIPIYISTTSTYCINHSINFFIF